MRIFAIMNTAIALIPLFGFVLMQYVMVDMLWPPIGKRLEQRCTPRHPLLVMELAFRALLVVISCERH